MPSVDTGLTISPLEHSAGFGAIVRGVDLNNLSDSDFKQIEYALYKYRLLVIKDQSDLHPQKQYELNCAFDPEATGKHGHGNAKEVMKKFKGKHNLTGGLPKTDLFFPPRPVQMVRIVGRGHLPAGHYGTEEPLELKSGSHQAWHKDPLTDTELKSGITRFQRWHIDAQLSKGNHTARVTTIYAHKLPQGPPVNLRWDDGSGLSMPVAPGRTAFIDSAKMYEALSDEDKKWVDHSLVEVRFPLRTFSALQNQTDGRRETQYAPSPYSFIINCKGTSNGFGIVSDDLETPLDELPIKEEDAEVLPLVWRNPVTGEKHLQFHQIVVRKIHYKESEEGAVRVNDDLREVRKMLDDLQRPFLRPENIIIAPQEETDLAVWLNRGTRHSAIEFPESYGTRIMHQCHLQGSDPVQAPWPLEGQPNPLGLKRPEEVVV
ncbi:hypothetical protein JCM11251_005783 [Rhodosporidiobolus azoricus]